MHEGFVRTLVFVRMGISWGFRGSGFLTRTNRSYLLDATLKHAKTTHPKGLVPAVNPRVLKVTAIMIPFHFDQISQHTVLGIGDHGLTFAHSHCNFAGHKHFFQSSFTYLQLYPPQWYESSRYVSVRLLVYA